MRLPYNPNEGYSKVEQGEHNGGLSDNLVGPAAGETLQTTAATAMMQVVAPATLPEGYEFEAAFGDRTVKVIVPPGGVAEGQTFSVPLPEKVGSMLTGVSVPVGHWRDGIFDIFHYGVCHPHCWTACCCPLLAAGQVISRLHLTWNGQPGNTSQTAGGFQTILILVVAYVIVRILLFIWSLFYIDLDNDGHLIVLDILTDVVHYSFYGWTVYVLWNVRIRLREKYAIPSQGTEDFCCSCFCPCFVAAQMLRHTTDYETYPATCCTERGIPAHAPSIV